MRRPVRVIGAPAFAAALVVPVKASAQSPLPGCGWPFDVNAQLLNIAYPDTHTNYWVQPYTMTPQSPPIVITGEYTFARYFSFVTYTSDGLPIHGSLHDSQIEPDAGSVNPFATANAPADPNQRKYTVRITPTFPTAGQGVQATQAGQTNVLPGLPQGQTSVTGFLVYRLYLPNNPNDAKAGVPLPRLNINGSPLTTCTDLEQRVLDKALGPVLAAVVSANSPDPATIVNSPTLWRRSPSVSGIFANPDNQYIIAGTEWAPGRLVVVRGKGATFPNTENPVNESVTTPTQLRYWDFCSDEARDPFPVVLCQADADTALDADGYYTYVVSIPPDRPANATTANGVTWLPWQLETTATYPSTVVNGLLYLRNMLPASTFTQAAQNVPTPASGATCFTSAAPFDPFVVVPVTAAAATATAVAQTLTFVG